MLGFIFIRELVFLNRDDYNEVIHPSPSLDQALLATSESGLFLTDQDKVDLVNFMKTLTDQSL